MKLKRFCLECGKELEECPSWPGVWICPDYKEPINSTVPYKYKCTGMEIEDEGMEAFAKEMQKLIGERN